jgi:hypothetical protein
MDIKHAWSVIVSIFFLAGFPAFGNAAAGATLQITEATAIGGTLIVRGQNLCEIQKKRIQVVTLGTTDTLDELAVSSCTTDADPSRSLDELAAVIPGGLVAATYQLVIDNSIDPTKGKKPKKPPKGAEAIGEYRDEFDFAYGNATGVDLAAEIAAREAADASLSEDLTAESAARQSADVNLDTDLSAEEAARIESDRLEAAARSGSDFALASAINAESTKREDAINAEASARQAVVAAEAAARIAADIQHDSDISDNSAGIAALNSLVDDLQNQISAITADIDSLDMRVGMNADDIADLQDAVSGLTTDIGDVASDLQALLLLHVNDIAAMDAEIMALNDAISQLQSDLITAVNSLNDQLAALSAGATENTADIATLIPLLAQVTTINLIIDSNTDRIEDLELFQADLLDIIADLQDQIDAIDGRLAAVEIEMPGNNGGLCFSFRNTPTADLTTNDFLDLCVDAAIAGGTTVRVVLKDANQDIEYEAEGTIVGAWTYDELTSTAAFNSAFSIAAHDRAINLDNGDRLLIPGRNSSNSGCSGSVSNGYGIIIYPSVSSGPHYHEIKLMVQPYRQYVGNFDTRGFGNWTATKEISWVGGTLMHSCYPILNPGPGLQGIEGTFEMYVF